MCLLIVLAGVDPEHPIIVASNRDEQRERKAMPPGLFVGAKRRMLSPRDRRAGGTWMAVAEHGLFAGLTNVKGEPVDPNARSRGELPHLALDEDDVEAAAAAVARQRGFNAFQLAISDGRRSIVLRSVAGRITRVETEQPVLVLSNEHALDALVLPGLDAALARGLQRDERLALLAPLLLDQGERSGHRVLKTGGAYGTVSSSLIAVPRAGMGGLVWRYANGSPDTTPYRDYGNLGRRLITSA